MDDIFLVTSMLGTLYIFFKKYTLFLLTRKSASKKKCDNIKLLGNKNLLPK